MRKNIESFNDIYKENLDKIPLDELGKIVYNQHLKHLEFFDNGGSDVEKSFKPIQDILEGVEFGKLAFLFSQLYMSTLIYLIVDHEKSYKISESHRLDLLEMVLNNANFLKCVYDMIEFAKKKGGHERLNEIQTLLESLINHHEDLIKHNSHKFKELSDVVNGEKESISLFKNPDDLEYLKRTQKELYDSIMDEVYNDEPFKIEYEDEESEKTRKALLNDVVSGAFFKKEGSFYMNLESESYKCLKKSEVEGE